jgi:predicted AAA+ superfamily ATPase
MSVFENAVFNQLRPYGQLFYLSRGSQYEVDFVLRQSSAMGEADTGLEVKAHPLEADRQRLQRVVAGYSVRAAYVVGRFPTPGFTDFLWGGQLF